VPHDDDEGGGGDGGGSGMVVVELVTVVVNSELAQVRFEKWPCKRIVWV